MRQGRCRDQDNLIQYSDVFNLDDGIKQKTKRHKTNMGDAIDINGMNSQ